MTNWESLRFMEQTLTLEDYEVEVFDNPVKALDYLGNDPDFAVIISDYRMPEIHGIEFLARSREIAPRGGADDAHRVRQHRQLQ